MYRLDTSQIKKRELVNILMEQDIPQEYAFDHVWTRRGETTVTILEDGIKPERKDGISFIVFDRYNVLTIKEIPKNKRKAALDSYIKRTREFSFINNGNKPAVVVSFCVPYGFGAMYQAIAETSPNAQDRPDYKKYDVYMEIIYPYK